MNLVCFVVILWVIFVDLLLLLEVKVLDDVVYFEVFPPLLSVEKHFFRFWEVKLACTEESIDIAD